ncbi:MAG: Tm-1-like ATP-binding domain-containing protein [Deltaproteobacteria bacterium]|nr:Tm-1-like ATP-binding domain-containing protein [Deltaproteobacteria bacterium]
MQSSIVIIATLDTKGTETAFLKSYIEKAGHRALVIDAGVLGQPYFVPDMTCKKVAKAGGKNLEVLVASRNQAQAMEVMRRGAAKIVMDMYSDGNIDSIIALGGGQGTALGFRNESYAKLAIRCAQRLAVEKAITEMTRQFKKIPIK